MTAENQIDFLQRLAGRFTQDANEANDLVQDTLYKSIKKRHLYKEGTNFKAWLATIMKNNFINGLRKKKRETQKADFTDMPYHLTPRVNNDYLRTSIGRDIEKAFADLDPLLADPFKMSLEGYAYEEIAQKYAVPLGTVKSRIFHARKKVQAKLQHLRA
jgi:RNA polymerase sigma-70 factor (ECF subfamily)